MKLDVSKEYKDLEDFQNYKLTNNLYEIARTNEKFAVGIHWDGVNSKNLKKSVYNKIGQIIEVKNASILANELAMNRKAPAIDDDDKTVQDAIKIFNQVDADNWERLDMNQLNEMVVYDGSIQGLGVTYWWWDDTIVTGNKFKSKGDINGKTIDAINLYVANPNELRIQKQPKIKITVDMTVSELKAYAEKKGVKKDKLRMIVPDEEDRTYRAFDKTDSQDVATQQENKLARLIINMEMKNGKCYKSEQSKTIEIEGWKDLDMKLFPVAVFPYKIRKSFFYAEAEPTRYIENQKIANTQIAMRHLHAALMAIPKTLIDENMIGSFSNAIGSINKVKVPPNKSLSEAMVYKQPTAMTQDVDKSVSDSLELTGELAGVNQNILGAARPENAAALLTQIKQANIPIESYRRRLYRYVKDVADIWMEFYKTKYNITRKISVDDKKMEFVGTDYKDLYLITSTDVGPSQQWSEITSYQALLDLWDRQIITDPMQVIERLPNDFIKDQQGLMDDAENEELLQRFIGIFLQTQPPEIQQQVSQLPLEEQKQFISDMLNTNETKQ